MQTDMYGRIGRIFELQSTETALWLRAFPEVLIPKLIQSIFSHQLYDVAESALALEMTLVIQRASHLH